MIPTLARLLLALSLVTLAACGSSGRGGRTVSSPFTEAHAQVFDDGVDMIEDPSALEGRWADDFQKALNMRLRDADLVCIGTVRAMQADTNLSDSTNYRVVLGVQRTIKGQDEHGDLRELSLVTRPDAAGYGSLERSKDLMLERRFVVFVKYAQSEHGVVSHFHLSPTSKLVLEELQAYEERQKPRVRVITHNN